MTEEQAESIYNRKLVLLEYIRVFLQRLGKDKSSVHDALEDALGDIVADIARDQPEPEGLAGETEEPALLRKDKERLDFLEKYKLDLRRSGSKWWVGPTGSPMVWDSAREAIDAAIENREHG